MTWRWGLITICTLLVVMVEADDSMTPRERQAKSRAQASLEQIAARDPRIEVLARAICAARGIDPDYQGFPYPPGQPVWETFILQARDFLAASDAVRRLQH